MTVVTIDKKKYVIIPEKQFKQLQKKAAGKPVSSDYENFLKRVKEKNEKSSSLKRITIVPANSLVATSYLSEIYTGKKIQAKELRKQSWKRKKAIL